MHNSFWNFRFSICTPVITDFKLVQTTPARLVEWFEYYRLMGAKHIYMPYIDPKKYPTEPGELQRKIISYYKRKGFAITYEVPSLPITIPQPQKMFRQLTKNKPIHMSYCLLKFGLANDYLFVHDFDEVIAFDVKRHPSMKSAITELQENNNSSGNGTFRLKDTPYDHYCYKKVPQLNYTSSIISKAIYSYKTLSLNQGKTIYHTQGCYLSNAHLCSFRRNKNILTKTPTGLPRNYKLVYVATTGFSLGGGFYDTTAQNVLRSFHYRYPYDFTGRPQRHHFSECKNGTLEQLGWLNPIQERIFKRSQEVMDLIKRSNLSSVYQEQWELLN